MKQHMAIAFITDLKSARAVIKLLNPKPRSIHLSAAVYCKIRYELKAEGPIPVFRLTIDNIYIAPN